MYQTSCVYVVEFTRTSLWNLITRTMSVETRLYTGEVVTVVYYSNILIGDIISMDPGTLKSMMHSPKQNHSLHFIVVDC